MKSELYTIVVVENGCVVSCVTFDCRAYANEHYDAELLAISKDDDIAMFNAFGKRLER